MTSCINLRTLWQTTRIQLPKTNAVISNTWTKYKSKIICFIQAERRKGVTLKEQVYNWVLITYLPVSSSSLSLKISLWLLKLKSWILHVDLWNKKLSWSIQGTIGFRMALRYSCHIKMNRLHSSRWTKIHVTFHYFGKERVLINSCWLLHHPRMFTQRINTVIGRNS